MSAAKPLTADTPILDGEVYRHDWDGSPRFYLVRIALERYSRHSRKGRIMTAKLSLLEIIQIARQIRDTMRDGLKRAAHYLKSLGVNVEIAIWALVAY